MSAIRPLLRRVAYRSGALSLLRAPLRQALTAVMFHRVLAHDDPDWPTADPNYTVSTELFDRILAFLGAHHRIVGLEEVVQAADGLRALPPHPLLITFDDGWADNLRHAAPLLQRRGMPAVIFLAVGPVLSSERVWWQERVFAAARQGALPDALVPAAAGAAPAAGGGPEPLDLVCRLEALDAAERAGLLETLPMLPAFARMMLAPEELGRLRAAGITLGVHGYTHLPLTRVADVEAELRRAREAVVALTGDALGATALACPHGRHDARVFAAARAVGLRLMFTSDPVLHRLPQGGAGLDRRPIGRISMDAAQLVDAAGRFDPARAARWLWDRPAR